MKKKTPARKQASEVLIWSIISLAVSVGVLIFKIANQT